MENNLKYIDFTKEYHGTISEIHDGGVVVDIDDRLGRIMVPMRMLISKDDPKTGQRVALKMSYIEQYA